VTRNPWLISTPKWSLSEMSLYTGRGTNWFEQVAVVFGLTQSFL